MPMLMYWPSVFSLLLALLGFLFCTIALSFGYQHISNYAELVCEL